MNVSILGIGYVGLSSGIALAKHGNKTICTTTTPIKAKNLNKGIPPFYETGLEVLVKEMVDKEMLSGSINNMEAVRGSDVTFICVGTPPRDDGFADLSIIKSVSKDIGAALKDKKRLSFGCGEEHDPSGYNKQYHSSHH